MSLDQTKINEFLYACKDAIEDEDWDSVFVNVANEGIFENGRRVLNLTEDEKIAVANVLLDNLDLKEIFSKIDRLPNDTFSQVRNDNLKDLFLACKVGEYSFEGTNIEKLHISSGAEASIAKSGFSTCKELKEVTIEGQKVDLGSGAFSFCLNLKTVNFSDNPKELSINSKAFLKCKSLESINIPDNVNLYLGGLAFAACTNLKHIRLPNKFYYGGDCFMRCDNLVIDYDGTQEEWDEITANEADFSEYRIAYKVNCLRK